MINQMKTTNDNNMQSQKPVLFREPGNGHKCLCCQILYSYLSFEDNNLTPWCPKGNPDTRISYPYGGETLSFEKLEEYLHKITGIIHDEPDRCKNCFLSYYDTEPQDGSLCNLKLKQVMLNQHRLWCNLNCTYCFFIDKRSKLHNVSAPYSVLPSIEFLIKNKDILLTKDCEFCWGGGESTILPEFEKVARLLADEGYKQILNTNGTVYSEGWAYALSKSKETIFNISIDAGTPETYKKIKGRDMFDVVWSNIAKYQSVAKSKYSFRAKYIVMEYNRKKIEIENFVSKCLETNIRLIEISVTGQEIYSGLTSETLEMASYLKTLARYSGLGWDYNVFGDKKAIQAIESYPTYEIDHYLSPLQNSVNL